MYAHSSGRDQMWGRLTLLLGCGVCMPVKSVKRLVAVPTEMLRVVQHGLHILTALAVCQPHRSAMEEVAMHVKTLIG